MATIIEGKPRDTLLKFEEPRESLIPEDKVDQKLIQKGLPGIDHS
jgi:hypothetical protein